jgi:hypothetical protein
MDRENIEKKEKEHERAKEEGEKKRQGGRGREKRSKTKGKRKGNQSRELISSNCLVFCLIRLAVVEVDWQRAPLCSISESLVLCPAARVESHEERFQTYN